MIVRWRGDRALSDREGVAILYHVSQRSVRRWCTPIDYDPETGRALYDVISCEAALSQVLPRPETTAAARIERQRLLSTSRRARG